MIFVISYDIENDKVRNRISKVLEDYGYRVQESVFECRIPVQTCEELKKKLIAELKNQGNIRIYPICKECYAKAIGYGEIVQIPGSKGYEIR